LFLFNFFWFALLFPPRGGIVLTQVAVRLKVMLLGVEVIKVLTLVIFILALELVEVVILVVLGLEVKVMEA